MCSRWNLNLLDCGNNTHDSLLVLVTLNTNMGLFLKIHSLKFSISIETKKGNLKPLKFCASVNSSESEY